MLIVSVLDNLIVQPLQKMYSNIELVDYAYICFPSFDARSYFGATC